MLKALINNFLMLITADMPAKAIDLDQQKYIERYHAKTIGKLTILLHRYFGSDGDRQLHNHPHKLSIGIPLIGGYDEEQLQGMCPIRGMVTRTKKVRPWRWNVIGRMGFHRIAKIKPGTWTLFITWNRCQSWGGVTTSTFSEGYRVIFKKLPGVTDTPNDWYKHAIKGSMLRNMRDTNHDEPVNINGLSIAWTIAAVLTLWFTMPGFGQ